MDCYRIHSQHTFYHHTNIAYDAQDISFNQKRFVCLRKVYIDERGNRYPTAKQLHLRFAAFVQLLEQGRQLLEAFQEGVLSF